MHRVIHDERDERPIRPFESHYVDLSIGGAVGIQPERDAAVCVLRAPVDVCERDAGSERDAGGFQPLACSTHAVDQRTGDAGRIFAIPFMVRSSEQRLVDV